MSQISLSVWLNIGAVKCAICFLRKIENVECFSGHQEIRTEAWLNYIFWNSISLFSLVITDFSLFHAAYICVYCKNIEWNYLHWWVSQCFCHMNFKNSTIFSIFYFFILGMSHSTLWLNFFFSMCVIWFFSTISIVLFLLSDLNFH